MTPSEMREKLIIEAFQEVIVKPLAGRYDENLRAQDYAMFSLGYAAGHFRQVADTTKEGWVSVPEEPTEEMLDAAPYFASDRETYKAMLAARPKEKE